MTAEARSPHRLKTRPPPVGHAETALPPITAPPDAFAFGRNWDRFISRELDEERERIAAVSLDELVGSLNGKTFLDVGCGSGLFSLCAHRAGAGRVISVDVDADSVASTRRLHARAGSPGSWEILHRSILDPGLLDELGPADVVYSWGVLHHTGAMYPAIQNAAALVKPGGRLAIAIYNRVSVGLLTSDRWLKIKRTYNHAPRAGQVVMELGVDLAWLFVKFCRGQNPVREARRYRRARGMALRTDLIDWLGGYPYEFATATEIITFCERSCGLRCTKALELARQDWGNNQFVFERRADSG